MRSDRQRRPISDDLRRAGLMPRPLPEHSAVNSRGEAVDPTVDRRTADLELDEADFLRSGGWHAVSIKNSGDDRGGLTSHRGVLVGDEYIDRAALVAMVEDNLGFTFDEIHSVYRHGGRLSNEQRELRGKIDARLLALSRSGANMKLLGRVLGFTIRPNGNCHIIDGALARARKEEVPSC